MKYIRRIFLLVFSLSLLSLGVYANNNVKTIDINVLTKNDGSASVTQIWRGTFDEKTENYIPINTSDIEISDFSVSDGKGEYKFTDNWDIDASFEEKSRKCGINHTDDGIELCFGISSYGENEYTISYTVSNFVKAYSDKDGTNFMFVNPGMSTFPTNVNVSISIENTEITDSNADIWAFGFDGNVEFKNGKINAYTNSALEGSNKVIIMFCLDKGILSPSYKVNSSFEDVKERAFKGGDYGNDELIAKIFVLVFIIVIFLLIFVLIPYLIISVIMRRKRLKNFIKSAEYFREKPNGGNIALSYYLCKNFKINNDEGVILGALMLSMINSGSIEPMYDEKTGFMGRVKKSVELKLKRPPENETEQRLYEILSLASGEDGSLQEKELEKYAEKHYKTLNSFIDGVYGSGTAEFTCRRGFSKKISSDVKYLSDIGKKELSEIVGLKKYLEDFSLISERELSETAIWQDYMVYATLLGIAEKVISQLKKLYPDKVPEFDRYYNTNMYIAFSYYHTMYRSAQQAMQAARTAGSGGSASFGGGGGFSGGGMGGGSR